MRIRDIQRVLLFGLAMVLPGLLVGQGTPRPASVVSSPPTVPPTLNGLDQFIAGVMQEWHVPGLALGVIRNGQVVMAKGYGYRDVGNQLPVTPRTLMAIGSNSKSFTVVLMGMLADDGKLSWDTPVRTYLPDFQLKDEFATREMTPRDLVTHRSGLPRHDGLWYGRSFTRKELYERLRYLEPSASFRARYQYQNLMFMTAGYLLERITNQGWDDLVRARIFTPLGMGRSNTSVRDLPASDDFAFPYVWGDSMLIRVPFRNIDAVAPAGAINSSVEEMLKYIQFRIDQGSAAGKQLLSKSNETQMETPQFIAGGPSEFEEMGLPTYGLGIGVTTYRGKKLVQHGGGIDGFISAMSWMPTEKIGMMVLTNLSGNNPVPSLVTRQVYDRLLGLEPVDWVARTRKQDKEAEERRQKERKEREAERKPGTSPTHELAAYAGNYEHPAYGRLTVSAGGQGLEVSFDGFQARLKHFHYDTFEIEQEGRIQVERGSAPPFSGRVMFLMDKKGTIDRMAVPFEPAVADIVFVRK